MIKIMVPEFYLCQPDPTMGSVPSCASCCGVYNYIGHDRAMITENLRMQTRLMKAWDGSQARIEEIRQEVESNRPKPRFEVIYNCPFAGFLDEAETRVGCMLHPLHLGQDLRDHCRYGHRTCNEARCTAYTYLDEPEARAVMAAAKDWYLYGLCITDIDLVKDFIELCEGKLFAPVDMKRAASEPELVQAFGDYLALKEDWPFARDPGRFGKYFFKGREYNIYLIDYAGMGTSHPLHDGILLSLGSVIDNKQELLDAIEIIDSKVDAFVAAYSKKN